MNPGETWGNREILSIAKSSRGQPAKRREYVCRCTSCNAIETCSASALYSARCQQYEHCSKCKDSVERPKRNMSGGHCKKCYGITDRRPLVGPCACGEFYAPETIEGFSLRQNVSPITVRHSIVW